MYPADLKYTETHEWARTRKDTNVVTVGISQYAVEQLSDIVFLELPGVGGVDPKIGRQLHRTANALGDVRKGAVGEYRGIEGGFLSLKKVHLSFSRARSFD